MTKVSISWPLVHSLSDSMAVMLKVITCSAVLLAVYYKDLQIIFFDALKNEATNQILLILPLLAYTIYRKRKMLRTVVPDQETNRPRPTQHFITLIGILLSTTAIIFYWYGSYTFTPIEYHVMTLPVFMAGLILLFFNLETLRQLAFPIAFLIFLVPIPEEILLRASSTLSISSSTISSALANALGAHSTVSNLGQNPTIIVTRPDNSILSFSLDAACSGIYPIVGFIMFTVFVAFIARGKAWKKALIFLTGIPFMYFLNVIRIAVILLLGYNYGEQLALDAFHLFGGLVLILVGTAMLLSVSDRIFNIQISARRHRTQPCNECQALGNRSEDFCHKCGKLLHYRRIQLKRTDLAKILAALVAVTFLIWIQAPALAATKSATQLIIQTPTGEVGNTEIFPQIAGYNLSFIFRDKDFENASHQDASLIYLYDSHDPAKENIWLTLEVAQTRSYLHLWETCEITWPLSQGRELIVNQLDLRDIQILENPPILARYFAFQYKVNNDTQVVLYWFLRSALAMSTTLEQKQIKISLISYPNSPQEIPETENNLKNFAEAIADYWQPRETWTQIALIMSKNGFALSTISATLEVCMIVITIVYVLRQRRLITRTYAKIPDEDRRIVDAVQEAGKKSLATTQRIAETCSSTLDLERLDERLMQAEEAGLIKRAIANELDEPVQVWKSNIIRDKSTGFLPMRQQQAHDSGHVEFW